MKYPAFFDEIENITLLDRLSNFLGSFDEGIVTFSYKEIVKSAGHSCPTVMGAYLIALEGLKQLYKDTLPIRGEIKISLKGFIEDSSTCAISNVLTQVTGATKTIGFQGINGNFSRTNLIEFDKSLSSSAKFTRLDINKSINITYNPDLIEINPLQKILMKKISENCATKDETNQFKKLFQNRVKDIYHNKDRVIKVYED